MAPRKPESPTASRRPVTRSVTGSVSRKEKETTDVVSKPKTAGKKPNAQKGDRKRNIRSAGKRPENQIASNKSRSRKVRKSPKLQTANKQPEIQTPDKEPEDRTVDEGSRIQSPNRKRKASEISSDDEALFFLEPSVKKPRIFLKLKFDKPLMKPFQRASQIIAAIYWDVNSLGFDQGPMGKNNDEKNFSFYETQHNEARKVVRMAVDFELGSLSPAEKQVREARNIARFVGNFGWRILSICAWSEGFRRACLQEMDRAVWNHLSKLIRNNSESLVTFARLRNLDWRGLLLRYSNHPIPKLKQALNWDYKRIGNEHPHLFARTSTGGLRKLTYQGRLIENIGECEFNPANWVANGQQLEDPSTRKERHGDCALCGSSERCKCKVDSWVAGLIELVDYPVKGVGVRALSNFEKGDLLAEYVGELRSVTYDDPVYGLFLQSQDDDKNMLASISSQYKGNWTRFINHSCKPSTAFISRTIGDRVRMTVEAVRDISIFEEITIGYGEEYWQVLGRRCQCGERNCLSKRKIND